MIRKYFNSFKLGVVQYNTNRQKYNRRCFRVQELYTQNHHVLYLDFYFVSKTDNSPEKPLLAYCRYIYEISSVHKPVLFARAYVKSAPQTRPQETSHTC